MKLRLLSIAALGCLCLTACQKDDDVPVNPAQVTATISSPSEGQVFHTGDTVHIHANVSYPSELHGYEVVITDTAGGEELFSLDEHVHGDHFSIDTEWVPSLTTATALRLTLTTEIDHNGNEATKTVNFSFAP